MPKAAPVKRQLAAMRIASSLLCMMS